MMSTERKVALITGTSQGIGAGLVNGFLGRGYRVVANSRTIRTEAAGPPDVLTVAGNVTDQQTDERIVGAATDRFGRFDTLVNNAGILVSRPCADCAEADFAAVRSVNLAGFFHLTQRVARRMLERGSGHFVHITPALAEHPPGRRRDPSETTRRPDHEPAIAGGRRATDHPGPDGGGPGQRAGGRRVQRRGAGLAPVRPAGS